MATGEWSIAITATKRRRSPDPQRSRQLFRGARCRKGRRFQSRRQCHRQRASARPLPSNGKPCNSMAQRSNRARPRRMTIELGGGLPHRGIPALMARSVAPSRLRGHAPRRVYRGVAILAREQNGGWQARAEGVGALSAVHPTPRAAIDEIKRYLDEARRGSL